MTTTGPDSNILDAEAINWRLIVYPIVAVVVLLLGGIGYYFYQLDQQNMHEAQAHNAALQAKTPEDLVKVADQFPNTIQGTLARLNAANGFFVKKNYDAAGKEYQQIINQPGTDAGLHDAAQLGLGSIFEANNKVDDAINAYLSVARRGKESPYAPFAYHSIAGIYEQRGDKMNERLTLMQAASLDADSQFVKEAQAKLKALDAASASTPAPAPAKP
jgi:predicted negative regulator of RcsB-dependent stress response